MSEPIRISTKIESREVIVEDSDGNEKKWKVVKMFGEAYDEYLDEIKDALQVDFDGTAIKIVGLNRIAGTTMALLKRCLVQADNKPVPEEEIKLLPRDARQTLVNIAQELNAITIETKEELKNA